MIRYGARNAGLAGVTAHTLRHTAATWMLAEAGLPLLLASAMLGHRSTKVTEQVYAPIATADLRSAADLLGTMLASAEARKRRRSERWPRYGWAMWTDRHLIEPRSGMQWTKMNG